MPSWSKCWQMAKLENRDVLGCRDRRGSFSWFRGPEIETVRQRIRSVVAQKTESQACLPVAEFCRVERPFDTVMSQSTVSKKTARREALFVKTLRRAVKDEAERTGLSEYVLAEF